MSYIDLTGKTILVTGASSGIGRAVAMVASQFGARLVLNGRDEFRLTETYDSLQGSEHSIIVGDLSNPSTVSQIAMQCQKLDGLSHCAGISKPVPMRLASDEAIIHTFSSNLFSFVFLLRDLMKQKKFNNSASIVVVSSIAALTGTRGMVLYSASKAGLAGMLKPLAHELSNNQIRVNSVSPALVRTPLFTESQESWLKDQEIHYPLGLGTPVDVANAVNFLLSDAAAFITGADIVMDGGCTLIQ